MNPFGIRLILSMKFCILYNNNNNNNKFKKFSRYSKNNFMNEKIN